MAWALSSLLLLLLLSLLLAASNPQHLLPRPLLAWGLRGVWWPKEIIDAATVRRHVGVTTIYLVPSC